ncbi:MAG: class II aldolase/adducin family protein [Bacteroidales bacterium]|nr:class II aldolase/adducin family protein [Bacteroidales bacterium]
MNNEGYIKFDCIWKNESIDIPAEIFHSLNSWRDKLYNLSLIGVYQNGISYGNLSIKNSDGTFYITGSATGRKRFLSYNDYALVSEWHFEKNSLICNGKTKASSESLTHAAIYEADNTIKAVIHIHSEDIWNNLLNKIPATGMDIDYGTPEMAYELKRILVNKNNVLKSIIIMGGHREGILAFGESLDFAGDIILKNYQSLNN